MLRKQKNMNFGRDLLYKSLSHSLLEGARIIILLCYQSLSYIAEVLQLLEENQFSTFHSLAKIYFSH